MGKRFDAWVAEFESWGMTHDEAVTYAQSFNRSRFARAMDELEDAITTAVSKSLIGRLWRRVVNRATGDGEQ
jgi:hypothetical protein